MKLSHAFSALALAAASVASVPAAAADYSLTFQDVTFEFSVLDADTFNLTMLGTDAASGNWAGIDRVTAFMLKDVGTGFTGATATGPGGFVYSGGQLSAGGCGAQISSNNLCFTGDTPVAPSLSWNVDVVGSTLNVASFGPHLMVNFRAGLDPNATGSVLSAVIPAVPEPETYAMMLAGLAAIGFVARRRKPA